MSELAAVLNAAAGTTGLSAQGAANAWAGTTGYSLLGALNVKAGVVSPGLLALNGVLNLLAGVEGFGSSAAATYLITDDFSADFGSIF